MLRDKRLPTFQLILHLVAIVCVLGRANHYMNCMFRGFLSQMNGDDYAVAAVVAGPDIDIHILIIVKPKARGDFFGARTTGTLHQLDRGDMLLLHRKLLTFTNFRNGKESILAHFSNIKQRCKYTLFDY